MLLDAPFATPPAVISVQPLFQRGAPGTPGGVTWPARDNAAADAIPNTLASIKVQGFHFPGDGGEATYKRIAAPSTPKSWQFHDAGGTWWELAERRPNVAMFGALGTGAAETVSLQSAIDYARDAACRLYFLDQTYVSGQLKVYARTSLKGEGRRNTSLKLAAGVNADLLISDGFAALTGTLSTAGTPDVEIRDMTVDGNRAGNSGGRCIALFGASPVLERLWIVNAPSDGLHTEWGRGGEPDGGMEGSFSKLKIDRCGRHCWNFAGPHDSTAQDVIMMDASLNGEGAGINFNVVGEANIRGSGLHSWQRATSPRSAYAANIGGYGASNFDGCHFEGALIPLGIFSSSNTFSPSCRYYAASGGVSIQIGGEAGTENIVHGFVGEKNPGKPDCLAVQFRSNAGDYISDNVFDLVTHIQNAGQVDYGTKSGGNNSIRIRGYAASGYDWIGTPHARDTAVRDIRVSGGVQSAYKTSRAPRIAASVTFDGTTGAILSATNVKQVSKLSTGFWRIVFAETVPTGAKCAGACSAGPGPGVNMLSVPYGNSETSQDVQIFNTVTSAVNDGSNHVDLIITTPAQ